MERKGFGPVGISTMNEKVASQHQESISGKNAYARIMTNLEWSGVPKDQESGDDYGSHSDHCVGFPVFRSSPPSS